MSDFSDEIVPSKHESKDSEPTKKPATIAKTLQKGGKKNILDSDSEDKTGQSKILKIQPSPSVSSSEDSRKPKKPVLKKNANYDTDSSSSHKAPKKPQEDQIDDEFIPSDDDSEDSEVSLLSEEDEHGDIPDFDKDDYLKFCAESSKSFK